VHLLRERVGSRGHLRSCGLKSGVELELNWWRWRDEHVARRCSTLSLKEAPWAAEQGAAVDDCDAPSQW
jgi:hypothetical protein